MPSLSSFITLLICSFLVSIFWTEIVQQIHSFLASGVIFSHADNAFASEAKDFFKSEGKSCATPPEIFFFVVDIFFLDLMIDCFEFIKFLLWFYFIAERVKISRRSL